MLITPLAFREVDYSAERFRLTLTMDKVKNSPSINTDLPVSGQHEQEYYDYYAYPFYWGCGGLWGLAGSPAAMMSGTHNLPPSLPGEQPGDVHLRSANAVAGYHVEATDGSIGHVKDFIVDDETWRVCYMVVDTSTWWPDKSVLVPLEWATRISWIERTAYVGLARDAIRNSPPWTGSISVEHGYAEQLALHYGGIPGWASRDRAGRSSEPLSAHSSSGRTQGRGAVAPQRGG